MLTISTWHSFLSVQLDTVQELEKELDEIESEVLESVESEGSPSSEAASDSNVGLDMKVVFVKEGDDVEAEDGEAVVDVKISVQGDVEFGLDQDR